MSNKTIETKHLEQFLENEILNAFIGIPKVRKILARKLRARLDRKFSHLSTIQALTTKDTEMNSPLWLLFENMLDSKLCNNSDTTRGHYDELEDGLSELSERLIVAYQSDLGHVHFVQTLDSDD